MHFSKNLFCFKLLDSCLESLNAAILILDTFLYRHIYTLLILMDILGLKPRPNQGMNHLSMDWNNGTTGQNIVIMTYDKSEEMSESSVKIQLLPSTVKTNNFLKVHIKELKGVITETCTLYYCTQKRHKEKEEESVLSIPGTLTNIETFNATS